MSAMTLNSLRQKISAISAPRPPMEALKELVTG